MTSSSVVNRTTCSGVFWMIQYLLCGQARSASCASKATLANPLPGFGLA